MKEFSNLILKILKDKQLKYYLLNIANQISRHRLLKIEYKILNIIIIFLFSIKKF